MLTNMQLVSETKIVEIVIIEALSAEADGGGRLNLLLAHLLQEADHLSFTHLALDHPAFCVFNKQHLQLLGLFRLHASDIGKSLLCFVCKNLSHDGFPLLAHGFLLLHLHLCTLDGLLLL